MRRIDLLITQARRSSNNESFNATAGISDEEFIQYVNDAQDRLQSLIGVRFPDLFQTEKTISSVLNQESYTVPDDAFLGSRIDLVEFSRTSQSEDYYFLKKSLLKERIPGLTGSPEFYIRRSNAFLVYPAPDTSGGSFRVTYQKTLPRLDKRRGTVSAVTLTTNEISSLTLDTTVEIDDEELLNEEQVTIVDKYGVVKMRRIPITAINTTTGAVTVESGFEFESGETIEAGDYMLRGPESTTHSQLPNTCERYLIEYMNWRVSNRDSSNDAIEQSQILANLEADIVASIQEPDGDVLGVPIINAEFLDSSETQ